MFAAIIFEGLYFSSEQWLFHKFHVEPLKIVGMEGFFGTIMSVIALLITSQIQVPGFVPEHTTCIEGVQYYEGGLTALK